MRKYGTQPIYVKLKKRYTSFRKTLISENPFCFVCQRSGNKDNLIIHHIKPAKDFPELFLDASNCIVLCKRCHNILHYCK